MEELIQEKIVKAEGTLHSFEQLKGFLIIITIVLQCVVFAAPVLACFQVNNKALGFGILVIAILTIAITAAIELTILETVMLMLCCYVDKTISLRKIANKE